MRISGWTLSVRTAVQVAALFALTTSGMLATAQTSVVVPGNAGGYFGFRSDAIVPLVNALTVSGPATITITYISGTVFWFPGKPNGPNGAPWPAPGACSLPLQAARGIGQSGSARIGALMGAFVPQSRAQAPGFQPIDGTKNAAKVGILPNELFFIGESKTLTVPAAGTLFLGINDCGVTDNSGSFSVTVSQS